MRNNSIKKNKIGLIGCNGRMGQQILNLLSNSEKSILLYGVDKVSPENINFKFSKKIDAAEIAKVDVVIDFSSPELLPETIKACTRGKVPLILGTTGLSANDLALVKQASKQIAVLQSYNMSIGIWTLIKAFEIFTNLKGFDYQVEEIHHKHKKDAPSGTAILLKNKLEEKIKTKANDTVSIRGGGVFGIHKIFALSDEEMITFEHTALTRAVFAKGALHAAEWIINRKSGLYDFGDSIK